MYVRKLMRTKSNSETLVKMSRKLYKATKGTGFRDLSSGFELHSVATNVLALY